MTAPLAHPGAGRLAAIAAGEVVDRPLAAHLAACRQCRTALVSRDPSALFALLAEMPAAEAPPYPGIAAIESAVAAPHRTLRRALAVAATVFAVLAAVYTLRGGSSGALRQAAGSSPRASATVLSPVTVRSLVDDAATSPDHAAAEMPIVARVDSPTASVVTLVPPGGTGPSVTLILDSEFDL